MSYSEAVLLILENNLEVSLLSGDLPSIHHFHPAQKTQTKTITEQYLEQTVAREGEKHVMNKGKHEHTQTCTTNMNSTRLTDWDCK